MVSVHFHLIHHSIHLFVVFLSVTLFLKSYCFSLYILLKAHGCRFRSYSCRLFPGEHHIISWAFSSYCFTFWTSILFFLVFYFLLLSPLWFPRNEVMKETKRIPVIFIFSLHFFSNLFTLEREKTKDNYYGKDRQFGSLPSSFNDMWERQLMKRHERNKPLLLPSPSSTNQSWHLFTPHEKPRFVIPFPLPLSFVHFLHYITLYFNWIQMKEREGNGIPFHFITRLTLSIPSQLRSFRSCDSIHCVLSSHFTTFPSVGILSPCSFLTLKGMKEESVHFSHFHFLFN